LLMGLALFRGWRLPLAGLVGYAGAVVVLGLWLLFDEGRSHPLGPNEHYQLERWYGLGLYPPPQLLGLVLVGVMALRGVAGMGRGWRDCPASRRLSTPAPRPGTDTTWSGSRPAKSG